MVDSINNVNSSVIGQNYKKPSFWNYAGGVAAGSLISRLPSVLLNQVSMLSEKKYKKLIQLNADEFKNVQEAVNKTFSSSRLSEKGVSILEVTQKNIKEVTEAIKATIDKNMRFRSKEFREMWTKIEVETTMSGDAAQYLTESKKILFDKKSLMSAFHEIGHAVNGNLSKMGKIMQKCRSLSFLAVPIALIALLKNKKSPDEKPKNKIDKFTDFIKRNAGKLTFISALPMLAEEALASIRGNSFAKKALSPDLAKKVAKANFAGFCSYLGLVVASSIGIFLGIKVRDAIVKPKNVEDKK
ncbi:MAG TPA: hypothetical protein PLG15_00175 [Candidatus Gastranaerophilaceae bacterium]|nr:hypothetical protein [Candidatus Gastranaerophilaceae bacterium]HPT40782.1 hypothetical protein [Candidatus Gastranaerophilaceae bacterium]